MSNDFERLGIYSEWKKYWSRCARVGNEALALHGPKRVQDLQHFVVHGFIQVPREDQVPIDEVVPPRLAWESYVYFNLAAQAHASEFEFERDLVAGHANFTKAAEAFAAMYLSQMIHLEIHRLFPLRMGGRTLRSLSITHIGYTALGMVLGCEPHATRLARTQLAAYRKGYSFNLDGYPIYIFMLRVIADYLEERPVEIAGEALHEPTMLRLFDIWRSADLDEFAPACLAALDHHTHRCRANNANSFFEFQGVDWIRIPIEIWLIFKLRERLGLPNPVLDHPLMEGACGIVPPDVGFKAEPLIAAVYERMRQDGFDEMVICDGLNA